LESYVNVSKHKCAELLPNVNLVKHMMKKYFPKKEC